MKKFAYIMATLTGAVVGLNINFQAKKEKLYKKNT